jgi:hypothetical protein
MPASLVHGFVRKGLFVASRPQAVQGASDPSELAANDFRLPPCAKPDSEAKPAAYGH